MGLFSGLKSGLKFGGLFSGDTAPLSLLSEFGGEVFGGVTGRDAMKAAKKSEKKTQAELLKKKKADELAALEVDSEINRRKLLGAQGAYGNKSLLSRMSLNTSSQKLGG